MTLHPHTFRRSLPSGGLKERISARTGRFSQHNFAKCSDIVTRFLYWQNENSCKIGAALGPIRELRLRSHSSPPKAPRSEPTFLQ